MRGTTFTREASFYVECCCKCGVPFAFTKELEKELRDERRTFYCPNGHPQRYIKSTEQTLREELASEKRRHEWEKEARERAERDAKHYKKSRDAFKGQLTKIKARVGRGVCPCCNRFFENLHRHMETKHPDFKDPEAAN